MIYLDNAATSYKKPWEVYQAMAQYTLSHSVNAGRGGHYLSMKGAEGILDTAELIADLFNISNPSRIAFTPNATLALNMAIFGVMHTGGHIIVTSMDHNSVLRPAHAYGNYTIVNADTTGLVHEEDIEKAIRPDTKMIVMTHVSNVCGTLQPVRAVGAIAQKHNLLFLLDAAQSAGSQTIDVEDMKVDMLAFSGHKGLLGPLGTGGLYVRDNIELYPIIQGGTGSQSESLYQPNVMPDMLQSGTQNTPAIMALGRAVEYIKHQTPHAIGERERVLAISLIEKLANMSDVTIYGLVRGANRNGTVAFNISGMDSMAVCEILNDDYEIAVRGGWHCAYLAHETIGSAKSGAVRASFGAFNKERDVTKIANAVWRIIKNREFVLTQK